MHTERITVRSDTYFLGMLYDGEEDLDIQFSGILPSGIISPGVMVYLKKVRFTTGPRFVLPILIQDNNDDTERKSISLKHIISINSTIQWNLKKREKGS